MFKRTPILGILALCAAYAGCSAEDGTIQNEGTNPGGKADDTTVECAPDAELRLELAGFDADESSDGDELTNRVVAQCHNDEGFEDSVCCADVGLFDAYADATSCPQTATLIKPEGRVDLQRCADSESGQFVASACCSDLCSADAGWAEDGSCRGGDGAFEDSMCCFLNEAVTSNACEGAAWETLTIRGEERTVCRGESGQFALNTCCAQQCVSAISDTHLSLADVPAACDAALDLTSPEAECPGDAEPNAANLCHNPANGQFVKAACCEAVGRERNDRREEIDRERSDLCFSGERAGCLRDDFVCSFNLDSRIGDVTGDLDRDGERSITIDDIDSLTDREQEQIFAAATHLGRALDGEDFDVVFEVADEGEFFLIELETGRGTVDWVKFFAGDNEVGVMFVDDELEVVAEISDGDIKGCGEPREDRCPSDVEDTLTECMEVWMDDTGEDFFAAIDFCDGEVRFDGSLDDLCADEDDSRRVECFDEKLAQAQTCFDVLGERGDF